MKKTKIFRYMKFMFAYFCGLFVICLWSFSSHIHPIYKNGDLIFQSSKSGQSLAIQLATNSKYSHVGMIFIQDGKTMVLEAVQPVSITPIDDWIERGDDGHFVVKRLKNESQKLTPATWQKMMAQGKSYLGKDYDLYFEWSDKRMYCSELVWKIYKQNCNIEIGELRPLAEYNLSHPEVKKIMTQRYGDDLPLEELMISPGAMYNSKELVTIYEH